MSRPQVQTAFHEASSYGVATVGQQVTNGMRVAAVLDIPCFIYIVMPRSLIMSFWRFRLFLYLLTADLPQKLVAVFDIR